MKYWYFGLLALFFSSQLSAQHHNHDKCLTDHLEEQWSLQDPNHEELRALTNAIIQEQMAENARLESNGTESVTFVIPVVVHVIYADFTDNISRAQIEDGLRVLNEDFRRQNADANQTRAIFQGRAADCEIEFRLAKIDPQGNCTDGINRIQSASAINARDNVKPLSIWPNDKYLNIWTVRSIQSSSSSVGGTVLGYAYLPHTNQNGVQDGIVIRHDRLGTIGTALGVSKGRTLTHEAGHYLGLSHPFSNGCAGGDGVADTPPVANPSFGCNLSANTCSNDSPDLPDMIENYMDYADDDCVNLFTDGQKNIMRAVLTNASLRSNIKSASNLTATGINNPPACLPAAKFDASDVFICIGDAVEFTDQTEEGDPSTYSWSFPGGTPSTASVANPVITYNTPGSFDVSLSVSNAAGTDVLTKTHTVHVKQPYDVYYPNWSESFEASSLPVPMVNRINGGDSINFEIFTNAASNGNNSVWLNNNNASVVGEIDALVSPAITTIFTRDLSFSFDYAFARRDNADGAELRVYASTDCGQTWILRRFYRGGTLSTAANTTGSFVPAASEWRTHTINFDAYIGPDPLFIKLEFEHDGGNNLYLDNFRFSGTIGEEESPLARSLSVYPNPNNGKFTLEVDVPGTSKIAWEILSLEGKVIYAENTDLGGGNSFDLDLDLPAGVYVIQVEADGQQAQRRLIVQ